MATQKDQSLIHRELARKAQDIHRVKNIRDEDYKLIWDGYVDTIPANGTADLETYKMDKYLREMTDLILRERQEKAVKEENERRKKRGEKPMDKWLGADQHVLEGGFAVELGTANPQVRMEIYKKLYIGLVKEYGIEKIAKEEVEDIPTTHDQLMSQLLNSTTRVDDSMPPIVETLDKSPLESMKQPQLRKLAKDKGIETKKTDKKDELIAMISQK